jgi:hypothetical protein
MCKECGKPILSNSYRGQQVKLFLLKNGKVIEKMFGEYDSYGRVFNPSPKEPRKWSMSWSSVCELMCDKNKANGIAAIHAKCYIVMPKTRSEDDPNQGWGENREYLCDFSDEPID